MAEGINRAGTIIRERPLEVTGLLCGAALSLYLSTRLVQRMEASYRVVLLPTAAILSLTPFVIWGRNIAGRLAPPPAEPDAEEVPAAAEPPTPPPPPADPRLAPLVEQLRVASENGDLEALETLSAELPPDLLPALLATPELRAAFSLLFERHRASNVLNLMRDQPEAVLDSIEERWKRRAANHWIIQTITDESWRREIPRNLAQALFVPFPSNFRLGGLPIQYTNAWLRALSRAVHLGVVPLDTALDIVYKYSSREARTFLIGLPIETLLDHLMTCNPSEFEHTSLVWEVASHRLGEGDLLARPHGPIARLDAVIGERSSGPTPLCAALFGPRAVNETLDPSLLAEPPIPFTQQEQLIAWLTESYNGGPLVEALEATGDREIDLISEHDGKESRWKGRYPSDLLDEGMQDSYHLDGVSGKMRFLRDLWTNKIAPKVQERARRGEKSDFLMHLFSRSFHDNSNPTLSHFVCHGVLPEGLAEGEIRDLLRNNQEWQIVGLSAACGEALFRQTPSIPTLLEALQWYQPPTDEVWGDHSAQIEERSWLPLMSLLVQNLGTITTHREYADFDARCGARMVHFWAGHREALLPHVG